MGARDATGVGCHRRHSAFVLTKGRPTIKIGCGKIELMLFGASEELYEKFVSTPNATLTVVGSCSKNEWNGVARPQILIDDYEFKQKWIF